MARQASEAGGARQAGGLVYSPYLFAPPAQPADQADGPLRRGLVSGTGHRRLRRGEADLRMRPVAKWLLRRTAASAERERPALDVICRAVPVEHGHVVTFHQIRSVLSNLNRR